MLLIGVVLLATGVGLVVLTRWVNRLPLPTNSEVESIRATPSRAETRGEASELPRSESRGSRHQPDGESDVEAGVEADGTSRGPLGWFFRFLVGASLGWLMCLSSLIVVSGLFEPSGIALSLAVGTFLFLSTFPVVIALTGGAVFLFVQADWRSKVAGCSATLTVATLAALILMGLVATALSGLSESCGLC